MFLDTNILCVGMGWFPQQAGGLNRYVYDLTQQLAKQHNSCVELCYASYGHDEPSSSFHLTAITHADMPIPQRLWMAQRNFRDLKLKQIDAINLHFALYSFPLLNQLPKDCPVTFTFHGPWADEGRSEGGKQWSFLGKKWLEQRVYRRCDQFIVLSRAFGEILHLNYGVPWEKIQVIPGGIDLDRFRMNCTRRMAREQLGFPLDRPILFTPRRLVRRMGIDRLLSALALIKKKLPEVWLAVAGKGPLKSTLEDQIRQLNLHQNVRLLGYVPDDQLPLCYQAADLTVVPSQALEGFGLILLESLACGTPVLATPVGGMPEILQPFCPHLLTENSSIESLSVRIFELLSNFSLMPARVDCYEYAAANFDWKVIAPRIKQSLLQTFP